MTTIHSMIILEYIVPLEGKGVTSNIGQNETIMLGPSVMSAIIGIGKDSTSKNYGDRALTFTKRQIADLY